MKSISSAVSTTSSRYSTAAIPVAMAVFAVTSLTAVANAEGSGTVQVDISNVVHVDELGSPNNTVLQVSMPAGAVIQGIGWAGTLTTVGQSWADDADIAITDGSQAPPLLFTPGAGDFDPTPPGGTFYSTGGIVSLGSLGQPGYRINGGVAFIEFSESFVDSPGSIEAFWGNGSTFTIQYDIVPVGKCPADLTGDTVVDVSDLLAMLSEWGACPKGGACPADLNNDSVVDVSDLLIMLGAWGDCPAAANMESACCFVDGSCQDLTEGQCGNLGGAYQGDYTKCSTWSCPQPPDGTTCDAAIPLEIDGPAISGDTTGTSPPDLPLCQGAGSPPSNTGILWYAVEGNGQFLTARTCESAINTVAAVYCAQTCETPHFNCIAGSSKGDCDNPFQANVSWCSAPGRQYLIAVWSDAQSFGEVAVSVESGATCSNPVACALPCDGHCGSSAPSGCWCDDFLCQFFGDCCPGMCESCPDQPSCSSVCAPAQCPPGATPEGEACGANTNGGCNTSSSNPPMNTITCGETVCGTVWAADGLRDTDWYRLNLTGNTQAVEVTFSVQSDVPIDAFILEGGCPATIIETSTGCQVSFSACLTPGVYSLVIVPTTLHGLPCSAGPFRYAATVQCAPTCINSCAGWCGKETPQGCWCDDECWLFEDCCPDICTACPGTDGC